ncbi:MAG TPA: glucosaminidase domain-containing protein, partial [Coleofasciculaceae cyanobacterium]
QNRPQDIAQGIANGLVAWSRAVDQDNLSPDPYPPINISINGHIYDEQGIIVNGNAYIPVDIVDRFDINLREPTLTRLIEYGNVTYLRAVDLREAGVFVGWDSPTRTVLLRTIGPFDPNDLGEIIGSGNLSVSALEAFLRSVNPEALKQFPDIVELYLEEAAIEGVNPDVAFAQALLETDFFRFSGKNKPVQNNFGGLGAIGASGQGATFSSATIGVRAHIQHLKAYANREPLVKDKVDPRFGFVKRGSAPRVELLSNRWSADLKYGEKILAILRRLYQSAGLL